MKAKKYQTKMSRAMLEGLHDVIQKLLESKVKYDIDKLHFSVLFEVKEIARKRLETAEKETTISFTPAQAFALRMLSTDFLHDITNYVGNRLHTISNEVNKLYQNQY